MAVTPQISGEIVTAAGDRVADDTADALKISIVDPAGTNIGNAAVTALASAARTASANSSDLTNPGARGVWLALYISAASGTTPTLDVKLQRKDSVSVQYVDLPGGAFAQKTDTATDDLTIFPGIAETANRSVSDVLNRTWRVVATITGTTPSFTFSVAGNYVP